MKAIVSTRVCGRIGPEDYDMFPEIKTFDTDVPISHILEWAKSWGYGKKSVTHGNMVIQFEKD